MNFSSADNDILEYLKNFNINYTKANKIKTSVNYIKSLISLKYFEKQDKGNLYILYSPDDNYNETYGCLQSKTPNTLLLESISNQNNLSLKFIDNLKKISNNEQKIILCSYDLLNSNVPHFASDSNDNYIISIGKKINSNELASFLTESGYYQVPFIQNEGDFCIYGEVINIFPLFCKNPIRIYLDFDVIDKIYFYDLKNDENLNEIKSYSFTNITNNESESVPFTTYLSKDDKFIILSYEKISKPIEFFDNPANSNSIICEFYDAFDVEGSIRLDNIRSCNIYNSFDLYKNKILELLRFDYKIYVHSNSIIQTERLKSILSEYEISSKINYVNEYLDNSFIIEDKKIAFYAIQNLFNKRENISYEYSLQSKPIDDFSILKLGDLVVHRNHGIGKFVGFDRIEMLGQKRDYIKIEFTDKEFFYVPLERASLVEKYIGNKETKLDKLHSPSWSRKKQKALESARLFAETLLKLYAKRKMSQGFCHLKDTMWQKLFEESFDKEETEDQIRAIQDVKNDMESPLPMDRIICGDVGYGKTEVAFRACFKAIMSGKQVVFLSPTTILTSQHYNNFKNRCKDFPIKIKELSRIKTKKESDKIIEDLKNGSVDIVFATHKILQNNISIKNLGLLVIDEEQRFGVKAKEKIKELKVNVDTLTLTATPIPRTLYMSILKLKDISILKTPPKNRISTEVIIKKFNKDLVYTAINNEINRGGQVYYLHNNTKDIEQLRNEIAKDFSNLRIDSIHGKMKSNDIENSIYNFANGSTDILVSTTIIENGIDVPNANTLIVDDATIYGTSQLYQIKGRVGRSSKKAFAYLLYPEKQIVNPNVIARLKVINENKSLGSGFNIAVNDLAIRGSGNILSKQQSGHIEEVGLDMYMHLIDLCIKQLENKTVTEDFEVSLNLSYTAYVPDDYISETEVKFNLYKQLANATEENELKNIISKIRIKYGIPPYPLMQLYYINLIKVLCIKKRIHKVDENGNILSITYLKVKDMDMNKMLKLIGESKGNITLNSNKPNVVLINMVGIEDKLTYLIDLLKKI